MTCIDFCRALKPGDRIIVAISLLFSHHAIFWGWDAEGQGWIIENDKKNGVRFVTIEEFFFGFYGFVETREFNGTEQERYQAIKRAEGLVGSAYHLTKWNCEQFANYVQCNTVNSQQVRNTVLSAIGIGLLFG